MDEVGGNMRLWWIVRKLVLWVGIGCTVVGLVSMWLPHSGGSLLYLIGFPLLCLILFF